MKKHAIIPIFIPHQGCPNDCVFCNQKAITARQPDMSEAEMINTIETWLSTLTDRPGIETVEIAFFGGSFTGIAIEKQSQYLRIANRYKERGLIDKIHLSTRPDYINEEILDNLKAYGTDVIELGVQSFDNGVLKASGRGHDSGAVYRACELIQTYGFELGIQLMIGLPGDSKKTCIFSAKETAAIGPAIARLYPTVVIEGTQLMNMYRRGVYTPLATDTAVDITKEMYQILTAAGIQIIRVGLKSSDLIRDDGQVGGHTFHPAFRQLVEGAIAREKMEKLLEKTDVLSSTAELASPCLQPFACKEITFFSNQKWFSNMIGHKGCNKLYFARKYPDCGFHYQTHDLEDGSIAIAVAGGHHLVVE